MALMPRPPRPVPWATTIRILSAILGLLAVALAAAITGSIPAAAVMFAIQFQLFLFIWLLTHPRD